MTKFELNKALAEALGWEVHSEFYNQGAVVLESGDTFCFTITNWNDLMPLVIEHLSQLQAAECFYSENPQLALAECLLKVLEAKNG